MLNTLQPSQQVERSPTLSNSALRESIHATLQSSPYLPLRRLAFSEANGIVTLHGYLPSFYLKQLAQSLLKSIPVIREIKNQIEVVPPDRQFSVRGANFGLDALNIGNHCD